MFKSVKKRKAISFGGAVVLILLIAALYVIIAVDLVTCPVCGGNILYQAFCNTCGHDGKVTILGYVLAMFG